jgi:hypothetical protein
MTRTQKRITFFALAAVILIIVVVAAVRYFPLNKIMRINSAPDTEYAGKEQIRSQAPHALFFDFEVDPQSGNTNGLYKGIAHSGQYSSKAFGKNSFSTAIDRKASEIGMENLDAVAMSSWVYIFPTSNEITGAFVFTINNDLGVNICWKGISVSGKDIPLGKWFKISGLFDLSDLKLKENFKMQVYFWNNCSSDILVDDFYIVFGGQKPRKGDSSLVDMTKGIAFQPRFNFPPFPVNWLERQEINNQNSAYLIKSADLNEGEISPLDKICKGSFTNPDGKDDLLVVKSDGMVELYHFCDDRSKFIRIKTTMPPDLAASFKTGRIITGRFTRPTIDQVLVMTKEDLIVGAFDPIKDFCSSGNDSQTTFKVIWKTPLQKAKTMGFITGTEFLSDDFNEDKISELVNIANDGSWTMFQLNPSLSNPLRLVASGKENAVQEWQSKNRAIKVASGRFLSNHDQDLILTIFRSENGGSFSYSLRRYDVANRQFIPVFSEKKHNTGKTIGLDTLRPEDEFFTGLFDNSGRNKVLRYSRDWRFDLKEIKFNDTTFQVMANMDFTGYEKDFNPKYYDVFRIISGNFLNNRVLSLLVIGRNCKTRDSITGECSEFQNLPFLPNTLQFYSFQPPKK